LVDCLGRYPWGLCWYYVQGMGFDGGRVGGNDRGYCTPPRPSLCPLKTINRISGRFPGANFQGFKPSTNYRNQLKP
jgi:hypothetical protein